MYYTLPIIIADRMENVVPHSDFMVLSPDDKGDDGAMVVY